MKRLIILIFCTAFAFGSFAQNDTTAVKETKKNVVTVIDNENKVQVEVGESADGKKVEVITDEWGDTTHIKIGDQIYKVTYFRVGDQRFYN